MKQKYEVAQAMQAKRERLAELFKGFPDVTLTADQASEANQLNGELKELGEKLDELSRLEAIALNNQRALDAGRAAPQDDRPAGRVRDADPNAGKSLGQRFAEHAAYLAHKGMTQRRYGAALDDVKRWFADYYGATNAVVVLSGDVTVDQARTLMRKYFGSVPAGTPISRTTAWVPVLDRDRSETMQDKVPQAAIATSASAPPMTVPLDRFGFLMFRILKTVDIVAALSLRPWREERRVTRQWCGIYRR